MGTVRKITRRPVLFNVSCPGGQVQGVWFTNDFKPGYCT